MAAGRNDPCPCGSGKKYKHCCWRKDRRGGALETLHPAATGIAGSLEWEMELGAVPITIEGDPRARPALLMVVGDEGIIRSDLIQRPPTETADVADLFESVIRQLAVSEGAWPESVTVRYEYLAAELSERLAGEGVSVSARPMFQELDPLLVDARVSLGFFRRRHTSAAPETWAGWELTSRRVGELFRTAADFYRAAPWELLTDHQVLAAEMPGGRDWLVSVLGANTNTVGLSIIEDVRDLWRRYDEEPSLAAVADYRGSLITLDYVHVDELPLAGRREIKSRRWEVAGPEAYPHLAVLNTPGSGIKRAQADDLIALMGAVIRFVDAHRGELGADSRRLRLVTWTDPATNIELTFWDSLLPEGDVDWGEPRELAPGGAIGPRAEPGAALDRWADPDQLSAQAAEIVGRFEKWLAASAEETVVANYGGLASTFVERFLVDEQVIPVRAVNEYDLRFFLYDWLPRKMLESAEGAVVVLPALQSFFSYLADHEGIECPWAEGILGDDDAFERRRDSCPGSSWGEAGVGIWQWQSATHLHAREMVPTISVHLGERRPIYGVKEKHLSRILHRQWLLWRDQLIQSGVRSPEALRQVLEERTRDWAETPRQDFEGKTPRQVVEAEREALSTY